MWSTYTKLHIMQYMIPLLLAALIRKDRKVLVETGNKFVRQRDKVNVKKNLDLRNFVVSNEAACFRIIIYHRGHSSKLCYYCQRHLCSGNTLAHYHHV